MIFQPGMTIALLLVAILSAFLLGAVVLSALLDRQREEGADDCGSLREELAVLSAAFQAHRAELRDVHEAVDFLRKKVG